MALPADAAALDRLARHICGHADDLRSLAARLVAAAEHVRWHSPAACRFRVQARDVAADMRAGASRLDAAADALRDHTSTVRRVLEVAGAAVHAAQQAGCVALHAIGH